MWALSGVQHAPLTAIFLIAEITGGYTLFLPLMLVASVSYSAHYFERHSFYVRNLMFDEQRCQTTLISDVMRRLEEVVDVHESMPAVMEKFERTESWNLPVLKDGKYFGFVSKSRILNTYRSNLSNRVSPLRHKAPLHGRMGRGKR